MVVCLCLLVEQVLEASHLYHEDFQDFCVINLVSTIAVKASENYISVRLFTIDYFVLYIVDSILLSFSNSFSSNKLVIPLPGYATIV